MAEQRRWNRWLIGLAAAIGTLAVLHGVTWWLVTGRMLASLPAAVEQAAEAGWRMEGDPPERTGWPWTATLRVRHFAASRISPSETFRWSTDTMMVTLSPLEPTRLQLSWHGDQSVVAGAARVNLEARVMRLAVPLQGGPADLDIQDLSASPVQGIAGEPVRTVLVGAIYGPIFPLAAAITAERVELRPPLPAPLDGAAALTARLLTTVAFSDLDTPAQSAMAWRAAGGHVDIPELSLTSGPLQVSGRADGGLDAALQPQGRATLRLVGAGAVLDGAARAGWLGAGPARSARAVLQLLALGAPGGPVPLTVTLEDRTLTVAQFPLARLPALDWGAP